MRSKLDGMLVYFFQHLEECMGAKIASTPAVELAERNFAFTAYSSGQSTPTTENPPSATPSLTPQKPPPSPAQSLLNLFSRQILPTASTQHIPFLLFLCSSFSPSHTDLFLGLLVSQSLYGTTSSSPSARLIPLSQRVAATVYIGSVVCRARFVTDDQARSVLQYLLAYLDGKMKQTKMEDMPLFYAVCQAVMLIFCFRWRAFTGVTEENEGVVGDMDMDSDVDVEERPDGGKWLKDLDILQRVITSDLNPLLGCNPIIVSTFAKVAHQTNFAYCFSIIEANQQLSNAHTSARMQSVPTTLGGPSRQNSSNGIMTQSSIVIPRQARQANVDAGLDNYFPFDPYDLPRSGKFVENLYRTWGEVAIDAEDEEDDDDASSEGETEETGESVDADSVLSDRIAPRGIPSSSMKSGSGSWAARRRIFGKDGGLSSSLEGMSISPVARAGLVGRG
jgi:RNA polymerase I-specific transcription initiation factor RRN3